MAFCMCRLYITVCMYLRQEIIRLLKVRSLIRVIFPATQHDVVNIGGATLWLIRHSSTLLLNSIVDYLLIREVRVGELLAKYKYFPHCHSECPNVCLLGEAAIKALI